MFVAMMVLLVLVFGLIVVWVVIGIFNPHPEDDDLSLRPIKNMNGAREEMGEILSPVGETAILAKPIHFVFDVKKKKKKSGGRSSHLNQTRLLKQRRRQLGQNPITGRPR